MKCGLAAAAKFPPLCGEVGTVRYDPANWETKAGNVAIRTASKSFTDFGLASISDSRPSLTAAGGFSLHNPSNHP